MLKRLEIAAETNGVPTEETLHIKRIDKESFESPKAYWTVAEITYRKII